MDHLREISASPPYEQNAAPRFLPSLIVFMSIPLYLGYSIKHGMFGGALFAIMYSWAILSFVAVPLLIVIQGVFLARCWLGNLPRRKGVQWHAVGLLLGVGAMIAAFAAR